MLWVFYTCQEVSLGFLKSNLDMIVVDVLVVALESLEGLDGTWKVVRNLKVEKIVGGAGQPLCM